MPFSYFQRLNKQQKAIYCKSDNIKHLTLPDAQALKPVVHDLQAALATTQSKPSTQRQQVSRIANKIAATICEQMHVDPVKIKVLAKRPRSAESELYGLYEWEEGCRAQITLWMKTAQRKQVVAFRTFLRTLLHEICHHLDYHFYQLADSFHTEGFFKRESSLAHQLLETRQSSNTTNRPGNSSVAKTRSKTRQLALPLK